MHMCGKTSNRKSKPVQWKNSMDEHQSEWQVPGQPQILPEIESHAKFPHIPVQTGLKNINIDIMECLVVMENMYNVDVCKSPVLLCYINKLFGQQGLFEKVEESNTNDIETDHDREELSPVMKRR